ncbi:MAG: hypothetical protein AAF715_21425 [Myxococcota bacterium]
MRKFLFASLTAVAVGACGTDVGSDVAYNTDSFFVPTMNGSLDFFAPQSATFSSTSRFHAWTFELSGEGEVDLRTGDLATNVDTIIYLYEADEAGNKVGHFLAKNDDHDGALASRIRRSLPAGRYLLQVKAHKTQIRGRFEVEASCDGAGCPVPELPLTFAEQCTAVDETVAACVAGGGTVEACAPTDDPVALQCCNVDVAADHCASTCATSRIALEPEDVDFIDGYADEYGGIYDIDVRVAGCNTSFAEVIAGARNRSVPSNVDDLETWPEGREATPSSGILALTDADFFAELATIAHDDQFSAWTAEVDLGCPSCVHNAEQWVLFYPLTGTIITLTGEYGHD